MHLIEFIDAANVDTKLQYHDTLNPLIWDDEDKLRSDVRDTLVTIAREYCEFIKLKSSDVSDVILTGSNANYNWTTQSDLDLHIVADFSNIKCDFLEDYLQTKKELWNSSHNITIYGYDVELYAQDTDDHLVATGIYSIKSNQWLLKPKKQELSIDNFAVQSKAAELMNDIDAYILSGSMDQRSAKELKEKIKKLRRAGLESGGEFSVENLTFKALRNNGYLQHLSDYLRQIEDKSLSLELEPK
jgi:hypothetical protein